jgi:Carboxypeptidase regulatory-like domain
MLASNESFPLEAAPSEGDEYSPWIGDYIGFNVRSISRVRRTLMFKRTALQLSIVSVLIIVSWLSSTSNAQKGEQSTTGAPLKGVDVKLGKNPGGSPAARTTTDQDGKFTFAVVPAGEYILTLELKKGSSNIAVGGTTTATDAIRFCLITLNLPEGKKLEKSYDLDRNKAFDPAVGPNQSTSKTTKAQDLIVVSDGAHPLNGTIVKSKSNISNN